MTGYFLIVERICYVAITGGTPAEQSAGKTIGRGAAHDGHVQRRGSAFRQVHFVNEVRAAGHEEHIFFPPFRACWHGVLLHTHLFHSYRAATQGKGR